MKIIRLAAFSIGDSGGNPAGVLIDDNLPSAETMQRIAAEVGYAETVFATPFKGDWRVRYFSPETEVPFCGHATIALGAALAMQHGNQTFRLILNHDEISVDGSQIDGKLSAELCSPRTSSERLEPKLLEEALELFALSENDLDERIPPARINASAQFLLLVLKDRQCLADMAYDLDQGRELMQRFGLVTINLVYIAGKQEFQSRNPFASGGVYEDPATGAAAAAFCGYLRDIDWPHGGIITIHQGVDMGVPCVLNAKIPPGTGEPIQLSGNVRTIT